MSSSSLKVGIDLSPIGFRERAPGTAVHVENQARALLALDVEWDWVLVATPRALRDTPFFESFGPIVIGDSPLSYHTTFRVGRAWAKAGCALGLATAFFAPVMGPPVVTNYFDANAFHPVSPFHRQRDRVKSAVIALMWRFSRRRSRALFILSDYGRRRMSEVDPSSASKWVVAPCGCPPVPTLSHPPMWAERLAARPFILYAGDFSANKNQLRLIEAWDQVRRRQDSLPPLVLIGPCPADYFREVIKPACARVTAPDDVIIPGFLPTNEVGWAFHQSHAYIQPSFAEGFGLPVVEAMSCGTPVACSDSTSLPEVAGNAALLFEPSSVDSIAKALQTISFDETERSRLKAAGLTRAKEFTWKRNATIIADRIRAELALISAEGNRPNSSPDTE